MSQVSDKETNDDENMNGTDIDISKNYTPINSCGRLWDSTTENEDPGEDTDEGDDVRGDTVGVPQFQRLDSQQSSVSFRSDCSDSEQSDVINYNRKREKKFSVRLKSSHGDFGVSITASNMQIFIKNVKTKFYCKCQEMNIECNIDSLLLEIVKDDCILLEEGTLEFNFLKSSRITTLMVKTSPKVNPVKHMGITEVKDFGKWYNYVIRPTYVRT